MARYALIVGINQYNDKGIKALRFAENDAREMKKILIARGGFNAHLLLGQEATRDNILGILAGGSPWPAFTCDDQLLFYFAGHGTTEFQNEQRYFVLQTYNASKNTTALSLKLTDLRDVLDRLACAQCGCIFDTCRTQIANNRGGAGDRLGQRDIIADFPYPAPITEKNFQLLFGCRESEASSEDEDLDHGVLTYHVLRVLRTEPCFTFENLANASAHDMKTWWENKAKRTEPSKPMPALQVPDFVRRPGRNLDLTFFDLPLAEQTALPRDISSELERSKTLLAAARLDEARALVETLLRQRPESFELHRHRRLVEAAQQAQEEKSRQQRDQEVRARVAELLQDSRRFEAGGDLPNALQCAERAQQLQPSGRTRETLQRIQLMIESGQTRKVEQLDTLLAGAEALESSDLQQALDKFEEALRLHPGNGRATPGRERCRLRLFMARYVAVATRRLEESRVPLPELEIDLAACRRVRYDEKAVEIEAAIIACKADIEWRRAANELAAQLALLSAKAGDWKSFEVAARGNPRVVAEAWHLRALDRAEQTQADAQDAGLAEFPEFQTLFEGLFTLLPRKITGAPPGLERWQEQVANKTQQQENTEIHRLYDRLAAAVSAVDSPAAERTAAAILALRPGHQQTETLMEDFRNRLALAERVREGLPRINMYLQDGQRENALRLIEVLQNEGADDARLSALQSQALEAQAAAVRVADIARLELQLREKLAAGSTQDAQPIVAQLRELNASSAAEFERQLRMLVHTRNSHEMLLGVWGICLGLSLSPILLSVVLLVLGLAIVAVWFVVLLLLAFSHVFFVIVLWLIGIIASICIALFTAGVGLLAIPVILAICWKLTPNADSYDGLSKKVSSLGLIDTAGNVAGWFFHPVPLLICSVPLVVAIAYSLLRKARASQK